MAAIPAHWKIYWGTLLINMRDKFFPIKVFFRLMICGGARCMALCTQHLPPGVSVARISNETCVINPCNGVHEFTPEQRLLQRRWPIKRGMYSFHVLCWWSSLTTIWRDFPSPVERALPWGQRGSSQTHLDFYGWSRNMLTGHKWELLYEQDLHIHLIWN